MFNVKQGIKNHKIAIAIVLILFIIPFFWMKPGEIDMGGDGGSLYFYDPINFIKHYAVFESLPFGTGIIETQFNFLPFVTLIALLKFFLQSSYLLSVLHNSMKLVIGFIAIYGIMKELLSQSRDKDALLREKSRKIEIISILTGIFYIFSPILTDYDRYVNPLPTHDQVFLNPLIFYLMLKFILTEKWKYLVTILGVSLIFSHNFSYSAAPAVFSFYPFALLFLVLYVRIILKRALPIRKVIIGVVFFVFLHFFHLGPEAANLFDSGSSINTQVFSKEAYKQQAQYFSGVMQFASLAKSILLPPITGSVWMLFIFISPLIIILGFLKNRLRSKTFLLTGVFFLLTLFLMSAKVSYASIKLYEMFFLYIPGFGMFRNFYIQWMFAFTFFYTLMFGQALFLIYASLNSGKVKLISLMLAIYLTGSAWLFINGHQFNPPYVESDNVRRHLVMDPEYEKMLEFIRNVPYDGKLLQFPFNDFNHQVVHGMGDGAYIGTTSIGQLTGVKDFAGYWHTAPYSEAFLQAAKVKDYKTLRKILGLLNIRYVFYNSDPRVYDTTFTGRPFTYVRQFLPSTQKDYKEFIKPLVGEKLFEAGSYHLYLTKEESYIPQMYIPKASAVYEYNPKYDRHYEGASSFISNNKQEDKRVIYIEKNDCNGKPLLQNFCEKNLFYRGVMPKIYFKKISPTKYKVTISDVENSFILVFSDTFHRNWKLFISKNNILEEPIVKIYFNGDIREGKPGNIFIDKKTFETIGLRNIPEAQHFPVNGFANAWYIHPEDIGMQREATFIAEMIDQRLFYFALSISFLGLCGFIFWGVTLFLIDRRSKRRIVK